VVTAISLLIPSHVRISRAADIQATAAEVWQQVDDLQSWKEWNPFFNQLSIGEIEYPDTSHGAPPAMKIKETLIQLKEIKADERIFVMLTKGKKPVINGWKFIKNSGSDSATLQWYIEFNLRWYPWEKFASLLFEKSYGIQMELGLSNIKKIVEKDRASFY
jgi:ribosome-associated toxin RatA of RatAB toxin-antitoxin module